jgi:hypothetical protein
LKGFGDRTDDVKGAGDRKALGAGTGSFLGFSFTTGETNSGVSSFSSFALITTEEGAGVDGETTGVEGAITGVAAGLSSAVKSVVSSVFSMVTVTTRCFLCHLKRKNCAASENPKKWRYPLLF